MVNYKKINGKDFFLILIAYIVITGQLVLYSSTDIEPPDLYFYLTVGVIMIFNRIVPKNKYINIIRYMSNFIYLLYGLSIIIRLIN